MRRVARNASVNWNLMIGRKEHAHRPLSTLTFYDAWNDLPLGQHF